MPGYPGAVSRIRRNGREIFLKNEWGNPWDTILNEPVPRLIRMLVCDCFLCSIGGRHLSRCFRDPLIRRSLPANSAVRRTRLARAGKLSPRWVFSESGPAKTILYKTAACTKNALGYTEIYQLWNFFGYSGRVFTENSSRRKLSCTSQTVRWTVEFFYSFVSTDHESSAVDIGLVLENLFPITDKHSKESWNWLVKSSIPEALSPVLENFRRRFSRPNWLSVLDLRGCFLI